MGREEDFNASLAHIVLCCVSGRGIGAYRSYSYTHLGMRVNFFVHGAIGFLHNQSNTFNNDFSQAYAISYKATRYLALPCLMADLYRGDRSLSMLHLMSGLVPFTLALAGKENTDLGNLMIACNIISLCCHSHESNRDWGWFTAGAAVFAYFLTSQMNTKVTYPLGLALVDYCAYRIHHVHLNDGPTPRG